MVKGFRWVDYVWCGVIWSPGLCLQIVSDASGGGIGRRGSGRRVSLPVRYHL